MTDRYIVKDREQCRYEYEIYDTLRDIVVTKIVGDKAADKICADLNKAYEEGKNEIS